MLAAVKAREHGNRGSDVRRNIFVDDSFEQIARVEVLNRVERMPLKEFDRFC